MSLNDPSNTTLVLIPAILESVGLSPLLVAAIGILGRCETIPRSVSPRLTSRTIQVRPLAPRRQPASIQRPQGARARLRDRHEHRLLWGQQALERAERERPEYRGDDEACRDRRDPRGVLGARLRSSCSSWASARRSSTVIVQCASCPSLLFPRLPSPLWRLIPQRSRPRLIYTWTESVVTQSYQRGPRVYWYSSSDAM